MTLSTDVYVLDEVDRVEVFQFCQGLLAKYDDRPSWPHRQEFDDDQDTSWDGEPGKFSAKPGNPWTIANKVGQGLPAWLMLHYQQDGPLRTPEQSAEHDDDDCESDCNGTGYQHQPACWLSIDFDTAYGYKDKRGWGCGDLHAVLVAELGKWLDERSIRWRWRNEFTGEIHDDAESLIELVSGGFEASAWFRTSVLPAIAAEMRGSLRDRRR